MAARLSAEGFAAADSRAVVELARAGEPAAIQLVRESGRLIGEVLAASVNFVNPSVIVVGGDIAQAQEQLLAGIREVVYQRSLPLATRHLRIVRSQLADRAGVIGCRGDGDRAGPLARGDRRCDRRRCAGRARIRCRLISTPESLTPEQFGDERRRVMRARTDGCLVAGR